ncbi:MAG: DNA recombination protein RmuC, partial [Candidatus Poribacteria bacterium]
QKNLTDLSSNMMSLQQILANKQSRGAFGQMRMETIIKDGLPIGAYTFQATLSNGKRPDCLLHMPNTPAGVVIDAKFPLEGFEAFRTSLRDEEKSLLAERLRLEKQWRSGDVASHAVDGVRFGDGLNVEQQDACGQRIADFGVRLANTCEHQLLARNARHERSTQLPAGHDVGARPQPSQRPHDSQVGVRLHRVADDHVRPLERVR